MTTATQSLDWNTVRDATRRYNVNRTGTHDLRPYWRVMAYRKYAGQPECIVRARGFENVRAECRIPRYQGDRIVGSRAGFSADTLPEGLDADGFKAIVDEHNQRGHRNFWSGWDHTLADYPTLLKQGISGIRNQAETSWKQHSDPARRQFLESVIITLDAFSLFVRRHADACRTAGRDSLAGMLDHIASQPPRTFHEALQLVWLTQIVFVSEGRYANALGRVDQYLLPFYHRDMVANRITRDDALDLLQHVWAHIEELGEVTNICIGGLTPDNRDATNELSYLALEATQTVLSPHTNLSARFHDGTPETFHRACFECIRTGVGFPSVFNDHVLIQGLEEIGTPPDVARDYCMVGCIETMLAGRQQAWSDSRFNTPLLLLKAMQRMRQEPVRSYDRLMDLFREEVQIAMKEHTDNFNQYIDQFPADRFPDPFLSALTRDCIERGLDINAGGAQFKRMHGICIMGLATLADSLAAVRKLVFEESRLPYDDLMAALDADFEGHEATHQLLLNRAPKYGNADPYVDDIAAWLVMFTSEECLKHTISGGGRFVSAMGSNVSNIPAGKEIGATPDGRHAHTPLSDAASPHFGRDTNGPTAFLQSVARPDYHKVLTGSVVNMKFEPDHFQGEEGARRFAAVTHALVRDRIQELQFNFTGNELLHHAKQHPEEYPNLVVRVSGFSAYFTRLGAEVQDDIIRRRAHV